MAAVIAGDSLWVRGQLGVVRLDRHTGRFRSQLRLGDPARENVTQWGGFVGGAGSLWVTDVGHSAVFRVDLKTGVTVATIPISGRLTGVAVGGDAVWIADANGMILKLDPRTNEIVERIPVDGNPNGLAYGFGRLWIALN
jgi:streptogramin lyase